MELKNAPLVLITEKKLPTFLASISKRNETLHKDMHIACISAMAIAAEHGRTTLLNKFANSLNVNYKNALKDYARKTCGKIEVADGKNLYKGWLNYTKDDGFIIVKDRMDIRKEFLDNIQTVAAAPAFFHQDVAENVKAAFDDAALLTAINRLLAKATKAAEEGTVSDTAKAVVVSFKDAVEKAMPARASETMPKAA